MSEPCDCLLYQFSPHRNHRCILRRVGIISDASIPPDTVCEVVTGRYDTLLTSHGRNSQSEVIDGLIESDSTVFYDCKVDEVSHNSVSIIFHMPAPD